MIYHDILADALHGIYLVILLILDEIYFSEGAPSNELENFEIIEDKFRDVIGISRLLVSGVDGGATGTGRG